jgi:hypothetical protein
MTMWYETSEGFLINLDNVNIIVPIDDVVAVYDQFDKKSYPLDGFKSSSRAQSAYNILKDVVLDGDRDYISYDEIADELGEFEGEPEGDEEQEEGDNESS